MARPTKYPKIGQKVTIFRLENPFEFHTGTYRGRGTKSMRVTFHSGKSVRNLREKVTLFKIKDEQGNDWALNSKFYGVER